MNKTILTIAGNMGVGKTTLSKLLAKELGWLAFCEPQEDNPYLADFYKDMDKWAFHSQMFFLSRRMSTYQDMVGINQNTIQDRSIFEDAEVFVKNLHQSGHFKDRDYKLYMYIYNQAIKFMTNLGPVVYLQASTDTLMERIKNRGMEYEKDISREYVDSLNVLYEDLFNQFERCSLIKIDTNNLDLRESGSDLEHVKRQIFYNFSIA
jgi:deoxyadenosine/deoxycytidine kinase